MKKNNELMQSEKKELIAASRVDKVNFQQQICNQQAKIQFFQQIITPKGSNQITAMFLEPIKQLHDFYPDIKDQLCSRHSTLFGKLKTTFNKIYDGMQPTFYIIVKGNCHLVQQTFTDLKLSMALENGIIILVSKTYPQSQIFINGNHFNEEVIFSHSGQLKQGLLTMPAQFQALIKSATKNIPQTELNGAILYVHSNIPQNEFNYQKSLYIAVYLTIMTINDNLKNYSVNQMISILTTLNFVGQRQEIQRIFHGYHNRKFNLTLSDSSKRKLNEIDLLNNNLGNMMSSQIAQKHKSCLHPAQLAQKSQFLLDMNKENKFLFCKLDLARQDVTYEFHRRKQIQKRKCQLMEELKQSYKIANLFDLIHKIRQIPFESIEFKTQYQNSSSSKSMQDIDYLNQNQILKQPHLFLNQLMTQIKLVNDFSNQKISLESLVNQIWQINSKSLKLHSAQVVELVEDMKETLEIEGCMIVNQNFLMAVVNKNNLTELLCQVKSKMNKGELKSKSLFRIQDEELRMQRWSSDKVIGEKIFSSVPSKGIGIFDPSNAIWFD